jgi:hypothetical protein
VCHLGQTAKIADFQGETRARGENPARQVMRKSYAVAVGAIFSSVIRFVAGGFRRVFAGSPSCRAKDGVQRRAATAREALNAGEPTAHY